MRGMYIRLAQGNVDPSHLDDFLAHMRTNQVENARQRPGFRNGYLAVNRERARCVIISIWDTQEQAQPPQNTEGIARLQSEFGLQPEEIVAFEVTDQV
jgi:quinol monooxygenase YgiN